ncbi:MAG: hypothetical protein U0263_16635 [Polyangiaceae bacterium]
MQRPAIPRPAYLSVVAVALVSVFGGACASESAALAPQANIAETKAAGRDFREVKRRWAALAPERRGELEPALVGFLERHAADRRARVARIYLAWLYVQSGRVQEARALVAKTRAGQSGSARDFAVVAEAAILLREGKADQAYNVLTPLEGKIIDPEERFLYGEQRVLAALAARRSEEAVRAMRDWLAQTAPEERDAVQGRTLVLVRRVAADPLVRSLNELASESDAPNANPDTDRARTWLLPVVAERLLGVAIETRDGALARRLLDTGLELFRRGERGQELVRIASAGKVAPRILGRSLGLVLSVGSPEQRRRSAQVVEGVARALGLPASASSSEAVQLLTSEDDGSELGVARALADLAGQGAAVLIAGVDVEGASRAAQYSFDSGIPVLVLGPAPKKSAESVFLLSEPQERELAALHEELGERASVEVGGRGIACDVAAVAAGQPRFPVQAWKRDRVVGVLVTGDATCARDVARESADSGHRVLLGLGLEAGEAFGELGPEQPRFALSAGAFPYRRGGASPPSLEKQVERSGHAPSWFATLGHDAAVLAAAALAEFALTRVDDSKRVRELHQKATSALARAEGELWSTDHRGFGGQRVLPRTLGRVVWSKSKGTP